VEAQEEERDPPARSLKKASVPAGAFPGCLGPHPQAAAGGGGASAADVSGTQAPKLPTDLGSRSMGRGMGMPSTSLSPTPHRRRLPLRLLLFPLPRLPLHSLPHAFLPCPRATLWMALEGWPCLAILASQIFNPEREELPDPLDIDALKAQSLPGCRAPALGPRTSTHMSLEDPPPPDSHWEGPRAPAPHLCQTPPPPPLPLTPQEAPSPRAPPPLAHPGLTPPHRAPAAAPAGSGWSPSATGLRPRAAMAGWWAVMRSRARMRADCVEGCAPGHAHQRARTHWRHCCCPCPGAGRWHQSVLPIRRCSSKPQPQQQQRCRRQAGRQR